MSIQYDLFKNPPKADKEEKEPWLHARPVVIHTVRTEEMAHIIEGTSSFSSADVRGVLHAVSDRLYACLSNSQNVHLEGIGTFSVSLKSRPVQSKKDLRSPSVAFKDINFRPDPKMKARFRRAKIERRDSDEKKVYTPNERQERILEYIEQHESINQTIASQLNQCSSAKTKKDLARLLAQRRIRSIACGRRQLYIQETPGIPPAREELTEASRGLAAKDRQ